MEKQNQNPIRKDGKQRTLAEANSYGQLLKRINNADKPNEKSNVWNREPICEVPSSTVGSAASSAPVNPMDIFKKLREELTKNTPNASGVHRLPVQPAPYMRVAQEAPHQNKPSSHTLIRHARAEAVPSHEPSPKEGEPSPEHPTIICIVDGIHVTVDEARTLLNSHTSPPTLVTEKGPMLYTQQQLEKIYAHANSFHMKILEISTNNKRNLLEKIEARKLNRNNDDTEHPASSPDLVIDEAVAPASSTAQSTPPVNSASHTSSLLSSRRNSLPESTTYAYRPVASTTHSESEISAKNNTNHKPRNASPKHLIAASAQICEIPPSKAVKRAATYEEIKMPARRVPVADYTNSNYPGPGNQERKIYRIEQNRNSMPVYEAISPPPAQYELQRANTAQYVVNYDEHQQFYGTSNPMCRDQGLSSPQQVVQEVMDPMISSPYYMQRPRFIQPPIEMRQGYAVHNPQGGWYGPPIIPNNEQGVPQYYNRSVPIPGAQMNLLKQNPHFQRQVRHPGEPYFPM